MGSRDGETTQELKESRWFEISMTYKLYGTIGVADLYRITRVEDVSVSRIRWVSSWRCWQLAPRSSRLSWRKTWAPSTRGEESTSWESPEKFSTLFPYLPSAWLTCDHSCILKRTCLYLCIPIVFIIAIVFLYAWCCRGKDGECPKSPEHVLCQVQQTRKVQGGRHLNDLAPLTMSPHFQFRWHSIRSLLRASKLRAEGGELYFQSSYPALRISYRVSIKTRDLETFHSIEEYRVWYLQYRV